MAVVDEISPKSGLTAFVLCLFLGAFGIHRFYVGKVGTGILMLITGGGLGFWTLYDIFSIVCKTFTDSHGRVVEVSRSPRAPRNVVLVMLAVFVILFGSIFATTGMMLRGVVTTGKNELSSLRSGNISQAYSYTSHAFQTSVPMDTFKKFVASYPQLTSNVSDSFSDVNANSDSGSIVGTLKMQDNTKVNFEMDMVKDNNEWKVNGINLKGVDKEQSAATPTAASPQAPAEVIDNKPSTDAAKPAATDTSSAPSANSDENKDSSSDTSNSTNKDSSGSDTSNSTDSDQQ